MRSWRRVLEVGFLLIAIGLLVHAVTSQWGDLHESLTRLSSTAVLLSLFLACAALVTQMLAWRTLLASDGALPSPAALAHVYFVGQLGKYVPGGVWSIAAQTGIGRRYGLSRTRSAVASVRALILLMTTGAIAAALGLVLWSPDSLADYWWTLIVIPLGVGCMAPPMFNWILGRLERFTRQQHHAGYLSARALTTALAWDVAQWLLFGLHTAVLALSLRHVSVGPSVAIGTSAFALAWLAGVVVVFAPSGVGVREAAMVLALAPVLPTADALVVALASRLLLIVSDAAAAGISMAATRLSTSLSSTAETAPPADGETHRPR